MAAWNHGRKFALSGISLALAIGLVACGEGTTGGGGGGGALTITTSIPFANQTDVALNTNEIRVTVAQPLLMNSVTLDTVHLMPAVVGDQDHEMDMDAGDADMAAEIIAGSARLEGTSTIVFTPSSPLSPGTKYHFHVKGIQLADGKALKTGTDVVEFYFTTKHYHETKREYFSETSQGQAICIRKTAVQNNERTMRQYTKVSAFEDGCSDASRSVRRAIRSGATLPLTTHYRSNVHSPTVNGIPVTQMTEYGGDPSTPGTGTVMVYEREYKQNGVDFVRFRADETNPGNFLATDWWAEPVSHLSHKFTYAYEAVNDSGVANFNPANAKNPQDFILDDASLMEMNHSLAVPTNGMYPHRHIFYRDLGSSGVIDIGPDGNPIVSDNKIGAYHTREYDAQGRRYRDWTFKGNVGNNANAGLSLNSATDFVRRVRVYQYQAGTNSRKSRITFEVDSSVNMTVAQWETALATLEANPTVPVSGVSAHEFRIYVPSGDGGIQAAETYHECNAACGAVNISDYGQVNNFYLQDRRTYTAQSTVALASIF